MPAIYPFYIVGSSDLPIEDALDGESINKSTTLKHKQKPLQSVS